jgi:flagellar biosynthesis/type III secretory pathway protein FliH
MSDIFDKLFGDRAGQFDDAVAKLLRKTIAERDAEIVRLNAQIERLKRKAQNLIDRAYNQGLDDGLDGGQLARKVRHAKEFGDGK